MDTTEQYIKMCEKATKIQALAPKESCYKWCWDDRQGSVFWLPEDKEFALYHWDNDEGHFMIGGYNSRFGGMIWLPRQDQLQAMVFSQSVSPRKLMVRFGKWCEEYGNIHYSAEQLWLSFVMFVHYNEVWTGEDWREAK